jgi:hypothetical protein
MDPRRPKNQISWNQMKPGPLRRDCRVDFVHIFFPKMDIVCERCCVLIDSQTSKKVNWSNSIGHTVDISSMTSDISMAS